MFFDSENERNERTCVRECLKCFLSILNYINSKQGIFEDNALHEGAGNTVCEFEVPVLVYDGAIILLVCWP